MTAPNLFGVPAKQKQAREPNAVLALFDAWSVLFAERFGERPMATGKDLAALKRLLGHCNGDAEKVRRRLALYLRLDDPYVAGQGYPLVLMLGQWNRLIAQDAPERSRVPDVERTERMLNGLRGKGAVDPPPDTEQAICIGCGYAVKHGGLCGECSCEDDGAIW